LSSRSFTPDEDQKLIELRLKYPGRSPHVKRGVRHPPSIGLRAVAKELGRATSSVHKRLVMLADREED
jgi:hypothetical protein